MRVQDPTALCFLLHLLFKTVWGALNSVMEAFSLYRHLNLSFSTYLTIQLTFHKSQKSYPHDWVVWGSGQMSFKMERWEVLTDDGFDLHFTCVCVYIHKVKVKPLRLFTTPRTVAYQAPSSMGFSRQEYWSGLPFPSPGDLPDPGIEPGSPAL